MRVFDFTLLSGYEFSGVDVAQGFRARLFAKNNVNAKFILQSCRQLGIWNCMVRKNKTWSDYVCTSFYDRKIRYEFVYEKEAFLENEKENYEYDNIDEDGKVIRLYNSGEKSVEILCDEDGFVVNESLFKNGKNI